MSTKAIDWSLTTDIVVVGGGGAGLMSAITAHDHGARVLVLEKMKHVGGITILAGGGLKAVSSVEAAVQYLTGRKGGASARH